MIRYVTRRLLLLIPTLFFVALITFALAHAAPGSPFDKNPDRPLPQETIERLERLYGVDRPLPEQFVLYIGNLLRFDLGSSLVKDRSVADIIGSQFPVSAQLGLQALLLALAVALPLGVISALRHNSALDYGSMAFATLGTTIPSFVIAIFAIYLFAVNLKLVPIVGWGTPKHMLLPTIILSLGAMAFLTRITRASVLEAIGQDHVRTARGKGLSEQTVIVVHVLKNAMIPIATIVGPATAGLITGSFIIETIFNVPGLGREFVLSIARRDYPLIMGVYLLYAFLIAVANLTVDILYGLLDPRIRVS
ncbi:MAG: ABC transporter permease [Chloroflexi bacterium]|nr:ABC transporter permease [Chloroflexota bacterium]